jgi:hypothetical protein
MKKIVFFIILIIILFAVPITVYFVGQQQELRSRAAPATVLAINPSTITKAVGDVFSFDIQIDTGGNNVAMIELHLSYDATKLEAVSITNGPLAPKIAASGVVGGGTASITVRAESSTQPIKGTGTVAVIRFKAIGSTDVPAQIKFDTTTYVSGLGESTPNVLVNSIPASVQITAGNQGDVTPTMTPVPSVSPTGISPVPTIPLTTGSPEQSTTSAEASASAVQITVQKDESGISPSTPLIQGKAPPGSTVTIVIHSDNPITVVVTTDANGNYQYTPSQPLTDGTHTIIVTSQNKDGTTAGSSSEFTVSSTASAALVEEAMPTSGSITYTVLCIGFSLFLLIGGVVIQLSRAQL